MKRHYYSTLEGGQGFLKQTILVLITSLLITKDMKGKVGQKIICIDDSPARYIGRRFLKKNTCYTIERINDSGNGFKLVEEPDSSLVTIMYHGQLTRFPFWSATRFKPLNYENISSELINQIVEERLDVEILVNH